MKKVKNTIENNKLISNNQHIVVGLSGGPDSVCLFHVLLKLSKPMNLTIHPVHINHKLRPGAAEHDQEYVENLCREKGLVCRTFIYDCGRMAQEEKMTSEEAGRKVRYESFAKVAEEIEAGGVSRENIRIAVAQNADDQAETILFRLLRGTGIDGITGISYERKDERGYTIVRPLLDVTKAEVMEYCRENGLNPCMDHTNQEAVYTRNKIRLQLIPYLEREYNANIKETLIRMGKTASVDSEYIRTQAEELYADIVLNQTGTEIMLKGRELRCCHKSIRRRVLSAALGQLGLKEDISYANFESCESIIFNDSPSARADLPKGYYVTKVYRDVKVCRSAEGKKQANRIRTSIMSVEEFTAIRDSKEKESYGVFDCQMLEEEYGADFASRIMLGTRETGDYISISEAGKKKIQDYFVDRKIPKDERAHVQMVKIGHEVLWVLPYKEKSRFSGKYKLCSDTKKVIFIEIICEM